MIARKLSVRVFYRMVTSYRMARSKLRVYYLRLLGANIGKNVDLGQIDVVLPERLAIDDNCEIQNGVRFRSAGRWEDGQIWIGRDSFVGYDTVFNVGSSLKIGKNCLIAAGCMLTDAHHPFNNILGPIRDEAAIHKPIIVEDDVWIGACVVVLQNVTLGKGSIIAANAVVNRDVPPNEIWGGVPARKISCRVMRNEVLSGEFIFFR